MDHLIVPVSGLFSVLLCSIRKIRFARDCSVIF